MAAGFSVNVLLFGDHADLAARCLGSLQRNLPGGYVREVCVGLNAVGRETRTLLARFAGAAAAGGVDCHVYEAEGGRNVGKYPLMRRMLYERPPRRCEPPSHVMWFDDDSYLKTDDAGWWRTVWTLAGAHEMVGSHYSTRQRGNQYLGIRRQPWYTGKPVGPDHRFRFCTGGWWVAPYDLLRRWDYPWPELHHNGGDGMLGELCRQQGYRMAHFNAGVAINADALGRESGAKRRGLVTRWVWQNFREGAAPDVAHQDFRVNIHSKMTRNEDLG